VGFRGVSRSGSLVDDDFEGSQIPRLTIFGCRGCVPFFVQGVEKAAPKFKVSITAEFEWKENFVRTCSCSKFTKLFKGNHQVFSNSISQV
jgi:hypothetical protein